MTLEQQKLANEMLQTIIALPKGEQDGPEGSVFYTIKYKDVLKAWSTFARAIEKTVPYETKD